MATPLPTSEDLLQRMVDAVERVRLRTRRSCAALDAAGVDYAVTGSSAVAAWVASVDCAAVRNTPDVTIFVRRKDLDAATKALTQAGFSLHREAGAEVFLDGTSASPRDAVRIAFAQEPIKPGALATNPDVHESTRLDSMRVLNLNRLVELKLGHFALVDRVDIRDLIDVGLIDQSWIAKLPPALGTRLQTLLDTPDG